MGGTNPYIKTPQGAKPVKAYTIEFRAPGEVVGKKVVVDPENMPTSATGLPGSLLDIALASDVDIDHACGGVCACATCHVYVKQGLESCNTSTDDEEDQLDEAPALTTKSRLSCQCIPNGSMDLVVEVPSWNRNLVREGR